MATSAALAARDRLAAKWDGLVLWVVNRWAAHPAVQLLGREDAEQAGRLGLLEAAARFDPARGTRFPTYAVPWIEQTIRRESFLCHAVRVPSWIAQGRRPVRPELAAAAERALACGRLAFDEDGAERAAPEPADPWPGPEEEAERAEAPEVLGRLLALLTRRERAVVLGRARGETLRRLGRRLGVSKQRVAQIQAKGMARMRAFARQGDY